MAKASGVRRCVQSGSGAVSARCRRSAAWHAGFSYSLNLFVCVVILGEARQDCVSQYNADADVVQAHMW